MDLKTYHLMPLNLLFALLGVVFFADFSHAANHYICSGAAGANNGSDWTNAWTSFPSKSSWIRGDIYYLAGGVYSGDQTIPSIPVSGSMWIYLKKATTGDHGTGIGWNDSYGTSQAVIKGMLHISSAYVDLNGITGSENSGYGIKMIVQNCTTFPSVGIFLERNLNYVSVSHMEVQQCGEGTQYDTEGVYDSNTVSTTGHHFSYIYVHDLTTNGFTLANNNGDTIIEHCRIERDYGGNAAIHGQGIMLYPAPMSGITIRFNEFIDIGGTAAVALLGSNGGTFSDIYIYGNILWTSSNPAYPYGYSPGAMYGRTQVNQSNVLVYNNSFYNVYNPNTFMSGDTVSGTENRNNIYVNCRWASGGTYGVNASTNNFYYGNTGPFVPLGEPGRVNGTASPFVNAPSDFHLTPTVGAIDRGIALPSAFAIDYDGRPRPQGAGWDIGAYEYVAVPPPPTNLRIIKEVPEQP